MRCAISIRVGGWNANRPTARLYYYTPQGTTIHGLRYSWFVNLEQPFSTTRIADPDHMRALDFIVDPVPTHANPDQLPLGFARRYDDATHDDLVDITCSACHNGQLNYTKNGMTTAIRIDGGPALDAFTDVDPGSFRWTSPFRRRKPLLNPLKFYRFAGKVLGPDANTLGQMALWRNLGGLAAICKIVAGSSANMALPVQEGYGRTDALARIGNVVFGDHISSDNYKIGDGPVSFPYLWNIWKFDWVQYNASVSQPMARNVGEAMGVGASYQFLDDYGRPVPKADRYRTSVSFDNLLASGIYPAKAQRRHAGRRMCWARSTRMPPTAARRCFSSIACLPRPARGFPALRQEFRRAAPRRTP